MSEWRVDGVDLDDARGRWCLTDATDLSPAWPAPRLASVQVPGRDGVLAMAPGGVEPVSVALGVLVRDSGRGRAGLDENLRALGALVRGRRLLEVEHLPAGGPPRRAVARLSGSVSPTVRWAEMVATLTLVLEVPGGLWRDVTVVEAGVSDLSALAGGVMPVPDPLVLVSGVTGPVAVRCGVCGGVVSWTGSPVSGRSLLLDPAAYRATWTAGSWSASGGSDVSAALSLSASWVGLCPGGDGALDVTVSGGTARIRARRAY